MKSQKKICIAGAGSIGTALGQILSNVKELDVTMLSIEEDVVNDINTLHINRSYFPQIRLNSHLKATMDVQVLSESEVIFLAMPSTAILPYIEEHLEIISPDAIIVNLAKGFAANNNTIIEELQKTIPNPVCSLKGPTFAREIINSMPTAMTVGASDIEVYHRLKDIFRNTTIYTDYSSDVTGVEILSILKNVYAIIIGIVDAHFNSPNLRFLIFTKAFDEMRELHTMTGGQLDTMFKYCGIGDFGLTSLNDLSRNRTLGLLIGKGFFTEDISGKVVLEGRVAVDIIMQKLRILEVDHENFFLLKELARIFDGNYDVKKFISNVLKNER